MAIGGVTSVLAYAAICHYYRRQPTIGEAVLCIGVGVLGGVAPDLLEPAFQPNHRQFFHSMTSGGLLLKTGTDLLERREIGFTDLGRILAACAIVGYLTHLVMDACTPKGLPIVGA
jgi:membrane-bound metal-dependent hydrolase YbcI (DUF457 family)